MNEYAATCPNCRTSFKVTLDLLRVAGGWAACGQCQHVFDAQTVLKMLAPDHVLRFLPNSISIHADMTVPRLTAATHIGTPERSAPSMPEPSSTEPEAASFDESLSQALNESAVEDAIVESPLTAEREVNAAAHTEPTAPTDIVAEPLPIKTSSDNVHIHINNAVPASERTAKHIFSSGHGVLSEQNAWEQRSRARRKAWRTAVVLLLIAVGSVAALSRPISAAWPPSVELFQTLGLPTAVD